MVLEALYLPDFGRLLLVLCAQLCSPPFEPFIISSISRPLVVSLVAAALVFWLLIAYTHTHTTPFCDSTVLMVANALVHCEATALTSTWLTVGDASGTEAG